MTKWVSFILAANIAVFFIQQTQPGFGEALALVPREVAQHPWTPFTYMFVHGGFSHILWNMLFLYFFGPRLETMLGGPRFLALYLLSGLGGAALSFLPVDRDVMIVGASGAILGVTTAYARLWPKDRIYLYGLIPVQAWWYVIYMIARSMLGVLGLVDPGTAHFAHLGGIVVGWGFMSYLGRYSSTKKFRERAVPVAPVISENDALARWAKIPLDSLHEINRGEVIRLLEKARASGARSLSIDERATLDRFSPA